MPSLVPLSCCTDSARKPNTRIATGRKDAILPRRSSISIAIGREGERGPGEVGSRRNYHEAQMRTVREDPAEQVRAQKTKGQRLYLPVAGGHGASVEGYSPKMPTEQGIMNGVDFEQHHALIKRQREDQQGQETCPISAPLVPPLASRMALWFTSSPPARDYLACSLKHNRRRL